jgi:hypothetical protein
MKQHTCNSCGFEAKNLAGLKSHERSHGDDAPEAPVSGMTRTAIAQKHCHQCHMLPAGSAEIVGLLLVLVFSLSAVLLTSVYLHETNAEQLSILEDQLAQYE